MKRFLILFVFLISCTATDYFNMARISGSESLYQKSCDMGAMGACNNLGVIYVKRGERERAIPLYYRACFGTNRLVVACQNYAELYRDYELGNYSTAVNAADYACKNYNIKACDVLKVIKKGRVGAAKFFYQALNFEKVNRNAEAEKLYDKSCKLGEMAACNNLGGMYFKRGNNKKASSLYYKACFASNRFVIACQNLAGLYKDLGIGSYSTAVNAADYACKNNQQLACAMLAMIQLRYRNLPSDVSKSRDNNKLQPQGATSIDLDDALKGAFEYNKIINQ